MVKKHIIIEGEENAILREGFRKFLNKKLDKNMPRIVMGGSKSGSIDKFKNTAYKNDSIYLLIDLDAPEKEREEDIRKNQLQNQSHSVFFMIQEMEAWFLSQKKIIADYYKDQSISNKLPGQKASEVIKPSKAIFNETTRLNKEKNKKGWYNKITHAADLLELLDVDKLIADFPDVKRMFEELAK